MAWGSRCMVRLEDVSDVEICLKLGIQVLGYVIASHSLDVAQSLSGAISAATLETAYR